MKSCLLCGENRSKVVFKEFGIPYLKCKKCGHLYSSYEREMDYDGYFEQIKDEDDANFYWDIAHKKMYESFARKYLQKREGRILDVGAGLGFFVKFASQLKGWQSYGVEISKGGYDFAKNRLKCETFFLGRIEEQNFENETFDIITMWDVIEHLPDPTSVLNKCFDLLKKDGILFLHTPSGEMQLLKSKIKKILFGEKEGMHFLEAKDHLNLYSQKGLNLILSKCGFKKIRFVHLPPIQAVAGKSNFISVLFKNGFYFFARIVAFSTFSKCNFDNLFAEAKK
jgi:2-polyprenyl-3-methyl-5-hydroxy-6-metoxy-1,4-benzoquinol methylase